MAQPPPPNGSYPNYGFPQPQQALNLNGNHQQPNMPNGLPSMPNFPPVKPTQQMPPQQAINYQNFQTKAIQLGSDINGSNSALSSRTSSPGIRQPSIPTSQLPPSQLPPSRNYPSYQQTPGTYPQQPPTLQPSSQLPMGTAVNNNNIGDNKGLLPHPNVAMPPGPTPFVNHQQQQPLNTSMQNLSLNPGGMVAPQMPMSKSDQNFMNNNSNTSGMVNNLSMPIMQPKVSGNISTAKRPMYPQQPVQPNPMAQPAPTQFHQPASQAPNSFSGPQMGPQPQIQMNPQQQQVQQPARGNLQYQNFPQPQTQPSVQYPGSVVQQGFSKMWGNDTVDLMQNRHILPTTKVLPPPIKLHHQFHEATNCSNDIFRCTLTKIPESNSLLQKSRLPLGVLIHPYRDLSVKIRNLSKSR